MKPRAKYSLNPFPYAVMFVPQPIGTTTASNDATQQGEHILIFQGYT